jgi:hypothetical protein
VRRVLLRASRYGGHHPWLAGEPFGKRAGEYTAQFAKKNGAVKVDDAAVGPLDTDDRIADMKHNPNIGYCNITTCCTRVCRSTSTSPTTR